MWSAIGHEKNKKYFENIINNGFLSHAYLFTGQEMTGKKKFAEDLCAALNNRPNSNNPDFKGVYPRFSEGETKIYIEDMREIKSFLSLRPYYGPYKFVLIDDADRLTDEAANAFLKTLEEPLGNSILFLITSKPDSLLPTISSRCQPVRFFPQTDKQIADFISANYELNGNDADFVRKLAGGRLGWIKNVLGGGNLETIKKNIDDFQKILKQGIFEKIQFAKKIHENGNYVALAGQWLDWAYSFGAGKKTLRGLLKLNRFLSQPQFNHRLVLENFLVNI
ncbi:MAG: hypothetical protein A2746_01360 [Candidatus Yanofskybacteria bacterium RIFCSPHIGHO2_01_FULL_44_22]|uniref:AAA+ ATPase domain-containing protein n=1 Tax=Candidatus Yanofskybacteria bacterium RIFCSPHIGHO2_01_FULL_44_22 TaxID=1802669 RepID=A0A1F8EVT2_9BACT|nr:MAG: hypothetical protein A2746_01360 [Candidatus Yanofskybacteria bacterium RIFCSPHIGHO2_01_FULL_44_22]